MASHLSKSKIHILYHDYVSPASFGLNDLTLCSHLPFSYVFYNLQSQLLSCYSLLNPRLCPSQCVCTFYTLCFGQLNVILSERSLPILLKIAPSPITFYPMTVLCISSSSPHLLLYFCLFDNGFNVFLSLLK